MAALKTLRVEDPYITTLSDIDLLVIKLDNITRIIDDNDVRQVYVASRHINIYTKVDFVLSHFSV